MKYNGKPQGWADFTGLKIKLNTHRVPEDKITRNPHLVHHIPRGDSNTIERKHYSEADCTHIASYI
jgi:hypothetical protein